MSSSKETCPLCQRDLDCEETVVVREKGAEGINRASIERGVDIRVESGTSVHKTCRVHHINKKDIASSKKDRTDSAQSVKRSARVSLGPYDSKTHCFFCGTEVKKIDQKRNRAERDSYSYVKTDAFVQTILVHCKTRGMNGPLQLKPASSILGAIFMRPIVFTTSHVTLIFAQCGKFQNSSVGQSILPND